MEKNSNAGDNKIPSKKRKISVEKNNHQAHTDGEMINNKEIQNLFNSTQIYSEIKNLSWMIRTLQKFKTLQADLQLKVSQNEGGEYAKNQVQKQKEALDQFSESVSKYIDLYNTEIKNKLDAYEDQIKSEESEKLKNNKEATDQEVLEKFMSQLVYRVENKPDITRGLKNRMRFEIAAAKIEYKLREHLVPKIINILKEHWSFKKTKGTKSPNKVLKNKFDDNNFRNDSFKKDYEDFITTPVSKFKKDDFNKLIKIFIGAHEYNYVDSFSEIEYLDVEKELGIQNIFRVCIMFKDFIKIQSLTRLVFEARNLRNILSHDVVIDDASFEDLKTKFLNALKKFKKYQHKIYCTYEIRNLIKDLNIAEYEQIFNDEKPEEKVRDRAGIEMILPPSFREKHTDQKSDFTFDNDSFVGNIGELFNNLKDIEKMDNCWGIVNDLFKRFPDLRDEFYNNYKNNNTTQGVQGDSN